MNWIRRMVEPAAVVAAAAAALVRAVVPGIYAGARFVYYVGGAAAVLWAIWQWAVHGSHLALHLPGIG